VGDGVGGGVGGGVGDEVVKYFANTCSNSSGAIVLMNDPIL